MNFGNSCRLLETLVGRLVERHVASARLPFLRVGRSPDDR